MPRPPRAFIEGGVYHVYNRVARGEPVFAAESEAARFVERAASIVGVDVEELAGRGRQQVCELGRISSSADSVTAGFVVNYPRS